MIVLHNCLEVHNGTKTKLSGCKDARLAIKFFEMPAPMGGCMGQWVGSGQMTNLIKLELINII